MICIAVRAGLAAGAAIVFGFTQISCANISPTTDVTAIRVDGDELVQTFGTIGAKPPLLPPDTAAGAYMFYKGGTLRFGKLLMLDAEMQVVDLRPSGFFDFSLDRYKEQLVAGYQRTLPDKGLAVYMLGLDKLSSASAGPASPPIKP